MLNHKVNLTKIIVIIRLLVLLLVVCSCVSCAGRTGVTPGIIPPPSYGNSQSRGQALELVESFADEFGYRKLKHGAVQARAAKVAGKILLAAGYKTSDFPVEVLDAGEEVNAMVLDGSSIVVFKKLMDKVTDEELAAVLSHEVGHLLAGHAAEHDEEQSRADTVSTASSVLGSLASIATSAAGYGGLSNTVGSVTEGATGLIGYGAYVGSFSRSQEYEADHIGLMLLAKAGYDPEAAIRLWSREEEIFGSASSSTGAFFSTHPAGSDRISKLQEYLPLAQQYRKTENRPR